jgi:hypothetical protein
MCVASSAALGQPAPLPAGPVAGLGPVMPPSEIVRVLRAQGFVPQATPVRNGEAYQVRAIDRRGRQVRLAIDARYGDILMVRPIAMGPPGVYGPRQYGPPPGYYGYYDDEPPTGAVGGYPPPGVGPSPSHTATAAPPPIPRPKPAAKPAVAAAPGTQPSQAAPAPTAAPGGPGPAAPSASVSGNAANAPGAMPPVAPLE